MTNPVTAALRQPYAIREETTDESLLLADRNEGPVPSSELFDDLNECGAEILRRYPDGASLERTLAEKFSVDAEMVLVTAGADEAIDRCCRTYLDAGRSMVVTSPAFAMLERFGQMTGCQLISVPWLEEAFPLSDILGRLSADTGIVAVVSPNNPTGAVISRGELESLSRAAGDALVLLDLAYGDYCDVDLTETALSLSNVVVVRTLSKAWGLAGCRVGYAISRPDTIELLRSSGGPYTVSAPSLIIAEAWLKKGSSRLVMHVRAVRVERTRLTAALRGLGISVWNSQANFVLANFGRNALFVRNALRSLGVLVRDFINVRGVEGSLRITLPGDEVAFAQMESALRTVLEPEALLFDLDGVIADVGDSYMECIRLTLEEFGARLGAREIQQARTIGGSNNDWVLTQRVLADRGIRISLSELVPVFQSLYMGDEEREGLRERESLHVSRELLERLSARYLLAIVTGRPRTEALWFMKRESISKYFTEVVALEDAPPKPDAEPVLRAMEALGVSRCWMVGDSPDDITAARAAGVVPIGIAPEGTGLESSNPAVVLRSLNSLEQLLP